MDRGRINSTTFRALFGCVLGALLVAGPAAAERLPGDAPIEDFEQTKDWVIEVDGEEQAGAQVYYSDYEVAWLLEVPGHGSLLVSPRGNSVQRVGEKALTKGAGIDASMDTVRSHDLVAEFAQSRGVITFDLEGRAFAMKPAPPVLGRRSSEDLDARHPSFVEKSAAYRTKAARRSAPLQKSSSEDVTVRVYFGSWSPICDRIVPKIMAVEESWGHVRFEYYGLPERVTEDPHAVDQRITGVPTVVVLRDGEEVDRLTGRQLDQPEQAIGGALSF